MQRHTLLNVPLGGLGGAERKDLSAYRRKRVLFTVLVTNKEGVLQQICGKTVFKKLQSWAGEMDQSSKVLAV